jgi:hypothetical protein
MLTSPLQRCLGQYVKRRRDTRELILGSICCSKISAKGEGLDFWCPLPPRDLPLDVGWDGLVVWNPGACNDREGPLAARFGKADNGSDSSALINVVARRVV